MAHAATLEVGPGRAYAQPSAAAAVAKDGDTVSIAPGEYFDCAIWNADHLTIEGEAGGEATVTDKSCAGKAAFIVEGNGITIRNLGFARIRVPDDNGAGIRADGRDLTVEHSRFVNDQAGILADSHAGGFLRVLDCSFVEQGSSLTGRVNFAVRAAGYDLLHIEGSTFRKARGGGHVSAAAGRTEIVGNTLFDEGGHMAGPLIAVQGGGLLLENDSFDISAGSAERPGAVLATGEATAIAVRGNTLRNAGPAIPALLRNWTGTDAAARDNTLPDGTQAVSDAGITYHRLRATAASFRDSLHDLYRQGRHVAAALVHRFGG